MYTCLNTLAASQDDVDKIKCIHVYISKVCVCAVCNLVCLPIICQHLVASIACTPISIHSYMMMMLMHLSCSRVLTEATARNASSSRPLFLATNAIALLYYQHDIIIFVLCLLLRLTRAARDARAIFDWITSMSMGERVASPRGRTVGR